MLDEAAPRLGLRANIPQFLLLILVNAFVGGMVGIERSILPELAQKEFGLAERTAILLFIAVFGVTKAAANYFAGRLGDRWGRKPVLVAGWIVAAPVPFLLMWAPNWGWVIVTNVFLGVSQGLTWSTAVIMKIDLAGPRNRGLAMGLNEFAGYLSVAIAAWATGYIAARHGLRPEPFYLGVVFLVFGLLLSAFVVKETKGHASHEAATRNSPTEALSNGAIFKLATWKDRNLSSATQAGFVNNLNDGLAWGLFPIIFAAAGLGLDAIGVLAGLYPAVWGISQLVTGGLSDRWGRKWLIASGMWVQSAGILAIALWWSYAGFATGAVLLGVGTAMVYPTLIASIGDVAHPSWRASAVGVYRLWRDLGYAAGAIIAGVVADLFGLGNAALVIAVLTFLSGIFVAIRMSETHPR
ncbi:MFS transporter [Qipengyuania sp. RANM35]|uniref:MFS transporter n=1 Tax=Qipengyuania sp. RANM35 TaxID=3068635 RepID=UPI0034DB71F1